MARRPEFSANAMTTEELNRLKRSLSMLSAHAVRDGYQKTLEKCRLREGMPPSPRTVQELVTLWKLLWRWRK